LCQRHCGNVGSQRQDHDRAAGPHGEFVSGIVGMLVPSGRTMTVPPDHTVSLCQRHCGNVGSQRQDHDGATGPHGEFVSGIVGMLVPSGRTTTVPRDHTVSLCQWHCGNVGSACTFGAVTAKITFGIVIDLHWPPCRTVCGLLGATL